MRLLLPVSFMTVAAASCCCCGGMSMDELTAKLNELQGGTTSVSVTTDGGGGGATPMATGGASGGTCGTFKADGLALPGDYTVTVCSEMSGTEALIASGSGDTVAACKSMKEWATGKGYSVTMESTLGGIASIILEKGDKQMTLACSSATGKPTISASISPK